MSRLAHKDALESVEQKGSEREMDTPPPPQTSAPVAPGPKTEARPERQTKVRSLDRPDPDVLRPQQVSTSEPSPSSLNSELSKLSLLDRFYPEPRVLDPPLLSPNFIAQMVYDQLFAYYQWRFTDIAFASDSTIAYVAQIVPAADRVAIVALNAIVNKLIIGNRTDGLPVGNLANPVGPPKGFVFPSVSTAVISAIGKTSPIWSGDQFFIPDLGNAIPAFNAHDGAAVNNIHQFPANPALDTIVARFCAAGAIPMRATDWKIPGGTPHWLVVSPRANGRVNCLVHSNVHPDNFDPPNTLLSTLASCTQLDAAATRYLIMRGIAENTVWSLITQSSE
jgi:hypothetical protein